MLPKEVSSFEIGPIRPPSEGSDHSLLIRATRNCPWNKCLFCRTYRGKKFEYRTVDEIKQDIDAVKAISDELKAFSWQMGLGGQMSGKLVRSLIQSQPELFDPEQARGEIVNERMQCMLNVANWVASGGKTVFLQDANTLIMRTPELAEILRYLKQLFPSIERITSYARSHTAARKTPEELALLWEAGLSRLHIGMESGCNEVLAFVQKGVTVADHVTAGRKIVVSGISLSEYVIPGLGGREWSQKHALDTASALNRIRPDFIRLRSLIAREGTGLHQKAVAGEFEPLIEDDMIDEIRLLIENLECRSYLVSDHMANLLMEVEGQLPEAKQMLLQTIDEYRAKPLEERLEIQLQRRLRSHIAVHGDIKQDLEKAVRTAYDKIKAQSNDAADDVNNLLMALKQGSM